MSDDTPPKRINDISPEEWDALRNPKGFESQLLDALEQTLMEHPHPTDSEKIWLDGYQKAQDDALAIYHDMTSDGLTDAQRARISIECEECGE